MAKFIGAIIKYQGEILSKAISILFPARGDSCKNSAKIEQVIIGGWWKGSSSLAFSFRNTLTCVHIKAICIHLLFRDLISRDSGKGAGTLILWCI